MINKENLNKIPSSVREELVENLESIKVASTKEQYDASISYAINKDEKQRSLALIATGRIDVVNKILKYLKV